MTENTAEGQRRLDEVIEISRQEAIVGLKQAYKAVGEMNKVFLMRDRTSMDVKLYGVVNNMIGGTIRLLESDVGFKESQRKEEARQAVVEYVIARKRQAVREGLEAPDLGELTKIAKGEIDYYPGMADGAVDEIILAYRLSKQEKGQ